MLVHAILRPHCRALHMVSFTSSHNAPTENLKRRITELEKIRKLGKKKNPRKDDLIVCPGIQGIPGHHDDADGPYRRCCCAPHQGPYDGQERIERKIQKVPAGQGAVRMLSREEWDEIQEIRPRTPFESKLACPNARIKTGEPLRMEDVQDWTIDVLTDALTRVEEIVSCGFKDN